jgi:hypothetical protein
LDRDPIQRSVAADRQLSARLAAVRQAGHVVEVEDDFVCAAFAELGSTDQS